MTSTFNTGTPGGSDFTIAMPLLVTQWNASATTRHLVHEVIGTQWADVTLQAAGPRTGTMSALFLAESAAFTLFQMLTRAVVVTFNDSDTSTTAMKFVTQGDITMAPDDQDRRRWVVTFGYLEVQA